MDEATSQDHAAPTTPKASGKQGLTARIISAAVLAPPVLVAVWAGTPWFETLIVLATVILAFEWRRLVAAECGMLERLAFFLALGIGLLGQAAWGIGSGLPAVAAGCGLLLVTGWITGGAARTGWLALGALYLWATLAALLALRLDPETGRRVFLWLLAVVWATDTAAYAAGRLIGGPKLAPAISPNKTWAGLIGGIAGAAVVGAATAALEEGGDAFRLVLLSGALAVVAQGGDLFESWVKRHFGVKDAGRLIPGHGGLFDRVDGLLAAALAAAIVFALSEGGAARWL